MVVYFTRGGTFALLALCCAAGDAAAFGRRAASSHTVSHCCQAVFPSCPRLCVPSHPSFSLHAWLYQGNGLVHWSPNQAVPLPLELGVTNQECYPWAYTNAEYGFHLFDDRGCCVPNAFILTTEMRTITVVPRASTLDRPTILIAPGSLQLGKRYTAVITLRGRSACIQFTPVLFEGPKV